MRAKSRQDISALGGYRRLAAWLPGWTLIPPISMAKGETGSDFRSGSAAAPAVACSQFSAFSCLVFVFVFIFVFGFLFSVLFLLCCVFF